MTEREFALQVVQQLQQAGHEALWAGGCVRDELLGREPNDYDIATSAHPQQVRELFRRTIAVGMSFGVVEVLSPRKHKPQLKVQVATFRSDGAYSDGRHPDEVTFSSPREDAERRDFTINGMFYDPIEETLHDYVGGQDDLQQKILRAIGEPTRRFDEDKLRLLRAVRMAMRFDLDIEPETAAAIQAMAGQIVVVSAERIAEELRQILVHPQRVRGLSLIYELGLVKPILPQLGSDDMTARWEQTLRVIQHLDQSASFPLALAALLHKIPAKTVKKIATQLRLSNAERDHCVWLVTYQRSLCHAQKQPFSKLKRIFIHGKIRDLLALHRALAEGISIDDVVYCEELLERWTRDEMNPPPLLTGDDLQRLGLKPGPQFKQLLDAVRDEQLDERIATRTDAEQFLQSLLNS